MKIKIYKYFFIILSIIYFTVGLPTLSYGAYYDVFFMEVMGMFLIFTGMLGITFFKILNIEAKIENASSKNEGP